MPAKSTKKKPAKKQTKAAKISKALSELKKSNKEKLNPSRKDEVKEAVEEPLIEEKVESKTEEPKIIETMPKQEVLGNIIDERNGSIWRPNPGPQEFFLRLTAREVLFGGSCGGGKSEAILIDALRGIGQGYGSGYHALLLRKTFPELEKNLIIRSQELYRMLGGEYKVGMKRWEFPGGEIIAFGHCENKSDVHAYQGSEFQYIGIDEVTAHEEEVYKYLMSRLRSGRGVPVRLRATANPGGASGDFFFQRFNPWLNPEAEYKAKPGEVLAFKKINDLDTIVTPGTKGSTSRTFVPSTIKDNPYLANDEEYIAALSELDPVLRAQLRDGNWLVKPAAGLYFKQIWFGDPIVRPPEEIVARVRFWDKAGTVKTTSDFTVGLRLAKGVSGTYYVEDIVRFKGTPQQVEAQIKFSAMRDGDGTTIAMAQDPGSAGVFEANYYAKEFSGWSIRFIRESGDKLTRALPVSSQAEAGRIRVCEGQWNKAFFEEISGFPESNHDDQVDALSGAFSMLESRKSYYRNLTNLPSF